MITLATYAISIPENLVGGRPETVTVYGVPHRLEPVALDDLGDYLRRENLEEETA